MPGAAKRRQKKEKKLGQKNEAEEMSKRSNDETHQEKTDNQLVENVCEIVSDIISDIISDCLMKVSEWDDVCMMHQWQMCSYKGNYCRNGAHVKLTQVNRGHIRKLIGEIKVVKLIQGLYCDGIIYGPKFTDEHGKMVADEGGLCNKYRWGICKYQVVKCPKGLHIKLPLFK